MKGLFFGQRAKRDKWPAQRKKKELVAVKLSLAQPSVSLQEQEVGFKLVVQKAVWHQLGNSFGASPVKGTFCCKGPVKGTFCCTGLAKGLAS